jgi:YNFM family putative membrane transporter
MGMLISGNALGGMSGRFIASMLTGLFSWRVAILFIGLASLLCAWWFAQNLPDSTNFSPQPFSTRNHFRSLFKQMQDPGLLFLYGIAFFLMGSFVTLYTYLGFQLEGPPFNLSQGVIGWIFALYILGSFSSAWCPRLAERWTRQRVMILGIALTGLGSLITLSPSVPVKVLGVALLTFGFFGAHSLASSWVGKRAGSGKAQASALYLFFYYMGSSIGATSGGVFWSTAGWTGVIGMISVFVLIALGLVGLLVRISRV